jgi:hypothetical protein
MHRRRMGRGEPRRVLGPKTLVSGGSILRLALHSLTVTSLNRDDRENTRLLSSTAVFLLPPPGAVLEDPLI